MSGLYFYGCKRSCEAAQPVDAYQATTGWAQATGLGRRGFSEQKNRAWTHVRALFLIAASAVVKSRK